MRALSLSSSPKGRGYVLLKDGSFAGYTQDEAKAGRFTTDENGAFVIIRPADTYTLIEKTAPSGYRINENIEPFVTDGIGHCTVKVEDQKITHSGGGGSTGGHSVKTTEIGPGEVPLAGLPESPVNETMILDEEVPLAGLPKTERDRECGGRACGDDFRRSAGRIHGHAEEKAAGPVRSGRENVS